METNMDALVSQTNTAEPLMLRIKMLHRQRRYAMKAQSRMDRSLEGYVRRSFTSWHMDAAEDVKKAANELTKKMIKDARKDDKHVCHKMVVGTDAGRVAFDKLRDEAEKELEKTAAELVVYKTFVEGVKGFGALGFATILGEAGDLSNYPTPRHLWSRLGFAPYDGYAGSSWKRGKVWTGRALSSEEWVEHPFNAERYSFMQQIVENMLKHQTISQTKTTSGKTEPKGPYGKVYCDRRAFTAANRDWADIHALRDAQRIVMKRLLLDLWKVWNGK